MADKPPQNHYIKLFGTTIQLPQNPPPQNNPEPPPPQPQVPQPRRSYRQKRPRPKPSPPQPPPPPPPPLPQFYRDFLVWKGATIDEHSPAHMLTRTLKSSDVNNVQNRLTLCKQLQGTFLTPEEEAEIEQKDEKDKPRKMQVKVVDSKLVERTMNFTKWNWPNSNWWYALSNNWMEVVRANGMAKGDSIQVWSFRVDGALGFIIHKVDAHAGAGSSSCLTTAGSGWGSGSWS